MFLYQKQAKAEKIRDFRGVNKITKLKHFMAFKNWCATVIEKHNDLNKNENKGINKNGNSLFRERSDQDEFF